MNWKPSINQTIRGGSTSTLNNKRYNLTEQATKLKVSARLSQSTNENILPLVLTISYSESIPDLIVSLNTGGKIFLTTFVENIDLFDFRIKVENPNASPAIICIQESITPIIPSNGQGGNNAVGSPLIQIFNATESIGSKPFIFVQTVPAITWTVDHNLGYRPDVRIYDAVGNLVLAGVQHTTDNQTLLSFNTPQSGSANFI